LQIGVKVPLSINPEHTPGFSPPSFASRMRTAKPALIRFAIEDCKARGAEWVDYNGTRHE